MAKTFDRPRLARALGPVLAAALLAGPGCLLVRETHQMRIHGIVLDAGTRRPVPGATVVVLSRQIDGTGRESRRYETGPDGRIDVRARRGWKLHPGLSVRISGPGWINEHYYMAPGYGWIFVPVGKPLGGRPPDRVLLSPLGPGVPRLVFDDTGGRVLEAEQDFELRVPSCAGVAQGLSQGGGLILYHDGRNVVMAAGAQESEGGLWFEGGPRKEPLRALEGSRMRTGRRAFLDPQSCRVRVEEGAEERRESGDE